MNAQIKTPIIGFLLASLTVLTLPIAATAVPGYKPPKRNTPQRTDSTGTRSGNISRIGNLKNCAKDLAVPMTLLMPDHTAQTTLAQPPLFLYLAGTKEIRVSLAEVTTSGTTKTLWSNNSTIDSPGIVQFSYPSDQANLAVGKTYVWQAAIVCGDGSTTSLTQAKIERIKPSVVLETQLKQAKTPQQQAEVYAKEGIWVDTIANTTSVLGSEKSAETDLLALIEQIGLKNIADREK
jgi:hypothetical protein